MNQAELLYLADCNLSEFCREQARWLPPFTVEERPHVLLVASGTRFPAGAPNCVFPLEQGRVTASELLDEAHAWFTALGRGFSVYAPTHLGPEIARLCESKQWARLSDAPGMVLTERVAAPELPAGVEIRTVASEREANDFIDVVAGSYESIGLPNAVARKLLSQPARWMRPYIQVQVAYEAERAVGAAMLLFSHGIAGVYWVGTLPDVRGRGHATRLMRSVSNRAFDFGARCVILKSTPVGVTIYRKLGYREFTRYPWFLASKESVARGGAPAQAPTNS
ncbi:MAG TPA: GNAT family N-acetyltransferase [Polyangiales bacterium]|nr:GNAT family N-acetyltransferase [Polyangiales bacterium]